MSKQRIYLVLEMKLLWHNCKHLRGENTDE